MKLQNNCCTTGKAAIFEEKREYLVKPYPNKSLGITYVGLLNATTTNIIGNARAIHILTEKNTTLPAMTYTRGVHFLS